MKADKITLAGEKDPGKSGETGVTRKEGCVRTAEVRIIASQSADLGAMRHSSLDLAVKRITRQENGLSRRLATLVKSWRNFRPLLNTSFSGGFFFEASLVHSRWRRCNLRSFFRAGENGCPFGFEVLPSRHSYWNDGTAMVPCY